MLKNFRRAAAVLALALFSLASPASAAEDDYTTPNEVLGEGLQRPAGDGGARGAAENSGVAGNSGVGGTSTLPVTGGDIVGLTVLGIGAIGVGTVLVRRGKAAPAAAEA